MFKLGYIKDISDKRDKNSNLLLAGYKGVKVSSSASLADYVLSILDQENLGSCVLNAGMQAVRMSQVRQLKDSGKFDLKNPPPLGSRLFGYYNSRAYHNATSIDSGTQVRYCFKGFNKYGFCPESVMPYDTFKYTKQPSHAAYKAAFDQRFPTDYYRITELGDARLDQIRLAISNGFPVVFGTAVSQDFCNGIGINGIIDIPTGKIAGGHAMIIEGFDLNSFTILNSWGYSFGSKGRILFSLSYLRWVQTSDLWVVRAAPNYSEPIKN